MGDVSVEARRILVNGIICIVIFCVFLWLAYLAEHETNWIFLPLLNAGIFPLVLLARRGATVMLSILAGWLLLATLVGHVWYDWLWEPVSLEVQMWVRSALLIPHLAVVLLLLRRALAERKAAGVRNDVTASVYEG